MREGYWVIRTYEAGDVGEKTKFWVPGKKPSRSGRREKTEIRKQLQNEYSVQKQLARLMNANFGPGDLLMGLDYSQEGMARLEAWAVSRGLALDSLDEEERIEAIRQAADWALSNLLRRVKRAMDKEGLILRYIAITSDMDGDTEEAVRVHHHLVVPKEAKAAFLSKWEGWGGVDWSGLSRQRNYAPIAEYFIRQVRNKCRTPKSTYPPGTWSALCPRTGLPQQTRSSEPPRGQSCCFGTSSSRGGPSISATCFRRRNATSGPPQSRRRRRRRRRFPTRQRARGGAPARARARKKNKEKLSTPCFVNFLLRGLQLCPVTFGAQGLIVTSNYLPQRAA